MAKTYKLKRNSLHERFWNSRKKIQFIGGGFGNGKTSAIVNKMLMVAEGYPGANILVARSTYPKLNDTIRKAVLEDWIPREWIKRRPTKDDNTLYLKNGTVINFRYVAQRGKQSEDGSTSSNLLSANYDLIIVDQIEDPEITHKDFLDLLGRLRGNTPYRGNDPTMPRTGTRWLLITANPAMNWVYTKLVRPMEMWLEHGIKHEDLLVDPNTGEVMFDFFSGSTYENSHNLEPDYLTGLEAAYKGQMRARYLEGAWAGFEGLVYPTFNIKTHIIKHNVMMEYLLLRKELLRRNFGASLINREGYDYGFASPSAYGHGVYDPAGYLFITGGMYEKEMYIDDQKIAIHDIRAEHKKLGLQTSVRTSRADPAIFRRRSAEKDGVPVEKLFDCGTYAIKWKRGDNDINAGIQKVGSWLNIDEELINPFTQELGSPRLFITDAMPEYADEISGYYWRKNTSGEYEDHPRDKDDHYMDMTKYMFTDVPKLDTLQPITSSLPMSWVEMPDKAATKSHRYAR